MNLTSLGPRRGRSPPRHVVVPATIRWRISSSVGGPAFTAYESTRNGGASVASSVTASTSSHEDGRLARPLRSPISPRYPGQTLHRHGTGAFRAAPARRRVPSASASGPQNLACHPRSSIEAPEFPLAELVSHHRFFFSPILVEALLRRCRRGGGFDVRPRRGGASR
jgi:hypothetical protein